MDMNENNHDLNNDNQQDQTFLNHENSNSDKPENPTYFEEESFNTKFENQDDNNKNNFYNTQNQYNWNYDKYNSVKQDFQKKNNKNKGFLVFSTVVAGLIMIPAVAFCGISFSNWVSEIPLKTTSTSQAASQASQTNSNSTTKTKESIAIKDSPAYSAINNSGVSPTQIAKKVIPSVVSVVPYARVQSFYQTGITEIGSASGVIMSKNGYIITNAHVVLKSTQPPYEIVDAVKVILSDDKEYEAKIIGIDTNTDLAIIKINANNLPTAEFGNSDKLEVGETVFAIGSPTDIEFAGSMTAGIVSALNRTSGMSVSLGNDNKYIQTDAAINPGNSGGALVNSNGQVIGINARKLASTGFSSNTIEGMGFAIPITQSKPILDDLINYGYVKGRVKLGISIIKEIDEMISKLNSVKTGLLIGSSTNADLIKAGIEQYDILHSIDGKNVMTTQELKDELKKHKPGDKVTLTFYRYDNFGNNEKKLTVSVKLIEDEGLTHQNQKLSNLLK